MHRHKADRLTRDLHLLMVIDKEILNVMALVDARLAELLKLLDG